MSVSKTVHSYAELVSLSFNFKTEMTRSLLPDVDTNTQTLAHKPADRHVKFLLPVIMLETFVSNDISNELVANDQEYFSIFV